MSWDRYAPSYGRQLFLERRALRTMLDLIAVQPGERLLDLGTGPAPLLEELAKRGLQRMPAVAVGVDSSPEMLARAPELPERWTLVKADASSLPFEAESFDVVVASYLLHVLGPEERAAVISEIARVLRPGGRVGTITIAPPTSPLMRRATAPLRRLAERSEGRLAGLRSLDPAPELAAVGLAETQRKRTFGGYPSLSVVAVKAPVTAGVQRVPRIDATRP